MWHKNVSPHMIHHGALTLWFLFPRKPNIPTKFWQLPTKNVTPPLLSHKNNGIKPLDVDAKIEYSKYLLDLRIQRLCTISLQFEPCFSKEGYNATVTRYDWLLGTSYKWMQVKSYFQWLTKKRATKQLYTWTTKEYQLWAIHLALLLEDHMKRFYHEYVRF